MNHWEALERWKAGKWEVWNKPVDWGEVVNSEVWSRVGESSRPARSEWSTEGEGHAGKHLRPVQGWNNFYQPWLRRLWFWDLSSDYGLRPAGLTTHAPFSFVIFPLPVAWFTQRVGREVADSWVSPGSVKGSTTSTPSFFSCRLAGFMRQKSVIPSSTLDSSGRTGLPQFHRLTFVDC